MASKLPAGWPRISPCIYYDDAAAAIDWLARVFGFEIRLRIEADDGTIRHSELVLPDDGLIMVSQATRREHDRSPRSLGGANTQSLLVIVDDADGHCVRARAAGAQIVAEPETHDYGEAYWTDRIYEAVDLEGHHWWFSQRLDGDPSATK